MPARSISLSSYSEKFTAGLFFEMLFENTYPTPWTQVLRISWTQ